MRINTKIGNPGTPLSHATEPSVITGQGTGMFWTAECLRALPTVRMAPRRHRYDATTVSNANPVFIPVAADLGQFKQMRVPSSRQERSP